MSALRVHVHSATVLESVPTYVGRCCREWVLAVGYRGRCGLCGEVPVYERPDQ